MICNKTTDTVSLNTWTNITVTGDSSGLKIYINGFISGISGAVQTLQSDSSGNTWTVTAPGNIGSLTQASDYLSLQDSTVIEPNNWFAGSHSTNVIGNKAWIFTNPGYSVSAPQVYWRFNEGTGTTANDSNGIVSGTRSGSTIPTLQTKDLGCMTLNL